MAEEHFRAIDSLNLELLLHSFLKSSREIFSSGLTFLSLVIVYLVAQSKWRVTTFDICTCTKMNTADPNLKRIELTRKDFLKALNTIRSSHLEPQDWFHIEERDKVKMWAGHALSPFCECHSPNSPPLSVFLFFFSHVENEANSRFSLTAKFH